MHKHEDPKLLGYAGFPDRLKKIVERHSVRGLSVASELSEGVIRKYMNGESYPTLDRLDQLARAGHVSLSWLATGEDDLPQGVSFDPPVEQRIQALGRRLSSMIVLVNITLTKLNPGFEDHPEIVRYLMSDVPFADLLAAAYGRFDEMNIWDLERSMEEEAQKFVEKAMLELFLDVIDNQNSLPRPRWSYIAPI